MCTNPIFLAQLSFPVNCGKCLECCTSYANMWAQRCMLEASLHTDNIFLTLTYEKTDGRLHKEDVQKFLKRLRKAIYPQRVRYYGCGEYGSKYDRPHYHLILFGYKPDDMKYITTKGDVAYYGSEQIEKIWRSNEKAWQGNRQGGFVSITEVNFRSARYCCKYLQKLDERQHEVKPFTLMSRKPAIGADAVSVDMLVDGTIAIDGKQIPVPKIFLDKLEKMGYNVAVLRERREYIAKNKFDRLKSVIHDDMLGDIEIYDGKKIDQLRKEGEIKEKRLKRMKGT